MIHMINFDTLTIQNMMGRFPLLFKDIFKELDNKSLVQCRKVNLMWQNFIDNQSFIWIQKIKEYHKSMKEFSDQWKLIFKNVPTHHIKELARAVETFFSESNITRKKNQFAPLHIAATEGLLELTKFIIEKTRDNNPTRKDGRVALHFAAAYGHKEVYRYMIQNIDDKNPADKRGIQRLLQIWTEHSH